MYPDFQSWLLDVLAIVVAIMIAEPLLELHPIRVIGRLLRRWVSAGWRRMRQR